MLGGRKRLAHGELRPQYRAVLLWKGHASRSAGAANLFQQLFAGGLDHDWVAPDAGERLDLLETLQLT
jgi:hypothetical protein